MHPILQPDAPQVLQRLLRLLLPSTTHPVHAAVICWLLAPLILGTRPEVLSGMVHAWAAVHLLLEHARAEDGGRPATVCNRGCM